MRVIAYLIILPTLSLAASCSLFTSADPVVDPPLVVSDGTPCGDACANMINCKTDPTNTNAETMADCSTACSRIGPVIVSCLATATCTDLDGCYEPEERNHCAGACRVLSSCDLEDDLTLETCSCFQYSNHAMGCIEASGCSGVEDCLLNAPYESACRNAANKLVGCSALESEAVAQWISSCAVDWEVSLTECIDQASCDVVVARCMPPLQPPSCTSTCQRLNACQLLGERTQNQCEASCTEQVWDNTYRRCALTTGCDQIETSCGEGT